MKLILAIVSADDARSTQESLTAAGYRVTRAATEGGFLKRANVTFLIGCEDVQIQHAMQLLKRVAGRRTQKRLLPGEPAAGMLPEEVDETVGGATLFVLPVDSFQQL
jgi:uncharacterized protein YaaQ